VLVNIGRGKTLDEDALVEGARDSLAAAALPACYGRQCPRS